MFFATLSAICVSFCVPAAPSTPHPVEVQLVSEFETVKLGQSVGIGVVFRIQPGWHVYWRNPGDSGEPPTIRWTKPAGWEIGDIQWPVPKRFVTGPLVNFGYEGEVLLAATLQVPKAAPAATEAITIGALSTWLVCREDCIPGAQDLEIQLPVVSAATPSRAQPLFAKTRSNLPPRLSGNVTWGASVALSIATPQDKSADEMRSWAWWFFPESEGVVDLSQAPTVESVTEDGLRLAIPLQQASSQPPRRLAGILTGEGTDGQSWAGRVDAPVAQATWASAGTHEASGALSTWVAILFALIGGLLLNLMPCVFPVLSLKVLGVVEQARRDTRGPRAHAWAYTLGVLTSFFLLGGLLLLLRRTGAHLGWGFQLQSPSFLAVMTSLFLLLGLSLSGVFSIGLQASRLGRLIPVDSSFLASFATGALATWVATPCTAPLMGPALGWALVSGVWQAMAVFLALGLGMALPFLVLGYAPWLARRLPRPGPWMETWKQFLAFPLYATTVWLLFVFAQQQGQTALFQLMAGLVLLAMAAWAWGKIQDVNRVRPLIATIGSVALFGCMATMWGAVTTPAEARVASSKGHAFWETWSPARVAALEAEGRDYFINFTAAWCVSCQVNERLVFAQPDVQAAFRARSIVALKADWTQKDATIARTLASYGRESVPLYVLRNETSGTVPQILPTLLTKQMVLSALAK